MKQNNTQRALAPEIKTGADYDRSIRALDAEHLSFTGEQFIPGAGVEICYEHLARYGFAARFVTPQSTVLDLGCGVGYGSMFLAERAKHVFALDRSTECIDALSAAVAKADLQNLSCIEADFLDAYAHPLLRAARIDIVVCHEFVEHIPYELQEQLFTMIAEGKPPFHSQTLFLVSTPERHFYAQTLSTPNQFHAHELNREEFQAALAKHFRNSRTFWQATMSANGFYPITAQNCGNPDALAQEADAAPLRYEASFLKWLDGHRLIASVADHPAEPGIYLYGVASNGPLPEIDQLFALFDAQSKNTWERMSIAARELRALETRVMQAELSSQRETAGAAESSELQALRETVRLQAQKIKTLIVANEDLGAQLCGASEIAAQIEKLGGHPLSTVEELKEWRTLGQKYLASDPATAVKQAEILWGYVKAMESPGHRLITSLSTRTKHTFFGRGLYKILNFLRALRAA